jgi:hypothetical protein
VLVGNSVGVRVKTGVFVCVRVGVDVAVSVMVGVIVLVGVTVGVFVGVAVGVGGALLLSRKVSSVNGFEHAIGGVAAQSSRFFCAFCF